MKIDNLDAAVSLSEQRKVLQNTARMFAQEAFPISISGLFIVLEDDERKAVISLLIEIIDARLAANAAALLELGITVTE